MNDKIEAPAPALRGMDLLRSPEHNKGTAFTEAERDALGLRGLLPPYVCTQDEQVARVLGNFRRKTDDLEKFINLAALHDRNEALFFRILMDHPDEMTPIVYTPTVGLACQKFGHIFQRPRGLYVTAKDRGRVAQVLRNWPHARTSIIVVTDGERILGLGDLGANGMGIPVGKLALYTACAGVPPDECLPVMLDVGTNNEELLKDPLYIGLHQRRLAGERLRRAGRGVHHRGARASSPASMVQFEDFANHNAFRLLDKYRDRICTFNDDIQGTAAVSLAGLFTALRVTGKRMADQTILFQGAGSAATGIAELAVLAMMADGLDEAAARKRCWLFDSKGLVVASRTDLSGAEEALRPRARAGGDARRRGEGAQAHRDHRRGGGGGRLQRGRGARHGAEQRAARSSSRSPIPRRRPNAPPSRPTAGAAGGRSSLPARRSIPWAWTASSSFRARATTPTSSPASAWA